MSFKYSQGFYKLKYPEKYSGLGTPKYRSSWEFSVMKMCDENPAIQNWASESVKIPYRDPLTGRQTVYVPDFLVFYIDKNHKKHGELWEVKPKNQTLKESVGKNPYNQAQYVRNMAKWAAASNWCKNNGIKFRILNETDLYYYGSKNR